MTLHDRDGVYTSAGLGGGRHYRQLVCPVLWRLRMRAQAAILQPAVVSGASAESSMTGYVSDTNPYSKGLSNEMGPAVLRACGGVSCGSACDARVAGAGARGWRG